MEFSAVNDDLSIIIYFRYFIINLGQNVPIFHSGSRTYGELRLVKFV